MPPVKTKRQEFRISAPTALTVQLVGDFTGWRTAPISLKKGSDGIWKASVELGPGLHHYRFVVDGEWRDDPDCELRVPNPFGSENSVRQVA